MAATRRAPPLQIFQDPVTSFDHNEHRHSTGSSQLSYKPLQPIMNVSKQNAAPVNPTFPHPAAVHPLKPSYQSNPPSAIYGATDANLASFLHHQEQQHQQKMLSSTQQQYSAHMSQPALFTTFPSSQFMDKENAPTSAPYCGSPADYPVGDFAFKRPMKRRLSDAQIAGDDAIKRVRMDEENDPLYIPEPEQMPAIYDDGSKPQYSYAMLIGMAILRAQNRRLTLAHIYKWITDTFKYYRQADSGWQNSIRHNLSLSKAFIKQERPKDDPGKGNYWTIEPGKEHLFARDRSKMRPTQIPRIIVNKVKPRTVSSDATTPPRQPNLDKIDSSRFPQEPELSSDATIPASDEAAQDTVIFEKLMPPPPSRTNQSSPPAAHIRSSPPATGLSAPEGNGTPPEAPGAQPSSRSRKRKQRYGGLGDSGYFSSIESSATKGTVAFGPLLTSEADADRPSMKKGRAEEEIARIRSSSIDSPSKSRSYTKFSGHTRMSSSPFCTFDALPLTSKGSLTPPVVFKKPTKQPPASISPNTNLRNHRDRIKELLASPDNTLSVMREETNWSPAFQLPSEDDSFNVNEPSFASTFDVFADRSPDISLSALSARGSPAKRPNLVRAATTANIIADIIGDGNSSYPEAGSAPSKFLDLASTPSLKPLLRSPLKLSSPCKSQGEGLSGSPLKLGTNVPLSSANLPTADIDELFGFELPSEGSEEGFDMLQGFRRIGAPAQNGKGTTDGSPVKNSRPTFARSVTAIL